VKSTLSLMTPPLLIFGVVVIAVLPPLGLICLTLVAIDLAAKGARRQASRRHRRALAIQKAYDDRIAAFMRLR